MVRSQTLSLARIASRPILFTAGLTLLPATALAQNPQDPQAPVPAEAMPPPPPVVEPPVVPLVPPPPPPVIPLEVERPAPTSLLPKVTLPPTWKLDMGGYIHAAYRWVQEPQNYNLAGRNNGFQLEQARLLANVQWKNVLAARVSFEGASEDRLSQSFPGGQLQTRLRDAYITWAPLRALQITVGQTVTPWDLDSMRSDAELPFVSRAVPIEGVQQSEGFTTRGLGADRNLGISIHSGFIGLGGGTTFRYAVFAGNGNGQNQILNDNNIPAVFGRAEFALWGKKGPPQNEVRPMFAVTDLLRKPILNIGIAGQWNPRTVGNLPDLIQETDVGAAADVALAFFCVELQGGVVYIKTMHDTLTAVPDLERFGWWAHVRVTLPKIPVEIAPGYRIASYSPRAHLGTTAATDADAQFDASFGLLYHTVSLTIRPTRSFPLRMNLNYTITQEQAPNTLDNDRFEVDAVAVF